VCLRNLKRGDQGPIWAVATWEEEEEEEEVRLQVVSFWEMSLHLHPEGIFKEGSSVSYSGAIFRNHGMTVNRYL
jgi:hypothetical protein